MRGHIRRQFGWAALTIGTAFAAMLAPVTARAQKPAEVSSPVPPEPESLPATPPAEVPALSPTPSTAEADGADASVLGERLPEPLDRDRAVDRINRQQLIERQVRSTPDALRYSPGVFVQQTGHGQASPFIRGRTGQQTVLLFDGLRINHALFRQGPNQYLFTVDPNTLDLVDVVRGSASVALGADAMSGAVVLRPRDPAIDPTREGVHLQPAFRGRYASADGEKGGRVELDTQLGRHTGLLVGYGLRDVGRLESSGDVGHLVEEGELGVPLFQKQVPTFEADGRTQLGTGFGEETFDARLVHELPDDWGRLAAAAYVYRQTDAPRTDLCPPPEQSLTECLIYEKQNRTQIYTKGDLRPGLAALHRLDLTFGWQRQFEKRKRDSAQTLGTITGGQDQIDVWGLRAVGYTDRWRPHPLLALEADFGVDGSQEAVTSTAYTELVRVNVRREAKRAQYLSGSTFKQGGVYLMPRLTLADRVTVRGGARFARAWVDVPAHEDSGTAAVEADWSAWVFDAGVDWLIGGGLSLVLNYEEGFRPPNLDDLTGRQLTGRGLQIENPDLVPESARTYEAGLRWHRDSIDAEVWVYHQALVDLMERRSTTCPADNRECSGQRIPPIQLVNLPGDAWIRGLEAVIAVRPGLGLALRATLAHTYGEGPSPVPEVDRRIPISRIPPLNGTAEMSWHDAKSGLYLGGAMRWANDQTRLSLGDQADVRIPFGGTPGYRVFDARAGFQAEQLTISAVFENLNDQPHRTHGSAINGPGRGVILSVEVRP